MSNASSSGNPSPKRVRYADESGVPTISSTSTDGIGPIAAARNKIISGTTTLHPTIQPQARTEAYKIIALYAKLHECRTKRTKFDSPDFVPRSARFKFALTPPNDLRESPEATTLVTEANAILLSCQQQLTEKMRTLVDLEIANISHKIDVALTEFCGFLANLNSLIHDGTINTINKKFLLAWIALTEIKNGNRIDMDDESIFRSCMLQFPATTPDGDPIDMTAATAATDETVLSEDVKQVVALVKIQIRTIIVQSLDEYDNSSKRQAQTIRLREFAKQFTTTKATDAVAMELDKEQSTDPETIKKLIASEVAKATKKLLPKENGKSPTPTSATSRKPNSQPAKNVTRGAATSASLKKKTAINTTSMMPLKSNRGKRVASANNGKRAAAVNNATVAASQPSGKPSSQGKQKKKVTTSNTPKRN